MIIGKHENFRVEVRPSWDDPEQWSITFWNHNHGSGLPYSLTGEAKAFALGQHLYDQLFPEFVVAEKRQKESMRRFNAEMAARPKRKAPKIAKNAPILNVLICNDCYHLILPDDVSDERVYECSRCNQTTSGDDARRCEQCNIFTVKVSDTSCPECGAAMDDAEKGNAQRATNGELVRYFTKDEIATQEAVRAEEQKKREAKEAERQREQEEQRKRMVGIVNEFDIRCGHDPTSDVIRFELHGHHYEIREVDAG